MVVNPDDEWNFTYVLPKLSPDEPTQLVVPSCLQMGWCESASYFCAASETSRNIGDTLAITPVGSLPPHPLKHHLVPTEAKPTQTPCALPDPNQQATFLRLLEVYIDDFIQLAQTTDKAQLLHLLRALLHAIHYVFPPPSVTGGTEEDPVAMKKLLQGDGLWATRKELLGWVFDGIKRCIELPPEKHDRIQSELHGIRHRIKTPRKDLERLQGKLRHACIGMPAGRGLLGPINAALRPSRHWIPV